MEHQSSRAFYVSRVDENGNDIEIRVSATRSSEIPIVSSARTFDMPPMSTRSSSVSSRASSRSVQYINPAVYIEKNAADYERSHQSGSTQSIPSVANSDIVPPLDLQSECFPTRREGYTFSYRHNGEPSKLKENPALAYENWLSAKRKILSDKAAKRRQEEEAKQREKEERKRLAAEKYQKWLESKQIEKFKQKSMQVGKQQREARPPADERKIQEKIEEWERNKRLEEEQRREQKRLEKEKREMEERKRRQLAQEAWNKWISEAPHKPKPVPLNRGLFTLRGTISDIFVNPNEWKSGDGF